MQPPRLVLRQGHADDARSVANDERHLLGRAERSGDEQIALILPIVVIGDDDDFAAGESGDDGVDALVYVVHCGFVPSRRHFDAGENGQAGEEPTWPRWRK